MGGGLALYLASRSPEVAACVAFYGVGPARDKIDFSSMRAAVLGHWGEQDHSYDHATIEDLEKRLREAGVSVESFWYDADHAFFNDDPPRGLRRGGGPARLGAHPGLPGRAPGPAEGPDGPLRGIRRSGLLGGLRTARVLNSAPIRPGVG